MELIGDLNCSFNVVEAASTVRNPKTLDYILSKYEKCREVGINFAKIKLVKNGKIGKEW